MAAERHRQRWQAGSIVTTVTDLPVASDVTDTKSGGFGHVNGMALKLFNPICCFG